ncbi:MAG: hypothetical protein CVV30_03735 [Methanomicrobiales archaeon HGW-Methanomicrobiales-1]|jgi:hypothetical protein|nr:MAG: hypothetical protein CVV30_03735 [Methanomicrobiales archaeon HGW-Methanomicrobiales-1]
MPGSPHSPLARLVLFMICLSVAGTCIAGVHYYAVDLPQQQNLQAPANTLMTCSQYCDAQYYPCIPYCKKSSDINSCRNDCLTEYNACLASC